jgi:hypothetical protein
MACARLSGSPSASTGTGERTIIRDAGWIRFFEDGLVVRGPHRFLDTDPADVYR